MGAALLNTLFISAETFNDHSFSYPLVILGFIFGILFIPIVVLKLPIFKQYYVPDTFSFDKRHHSMVEQKAALAMSLLVTAAAYGIILYLFDVEDIILPVFCSGLTGGVMSGYYDK